MDLIEVNEANRRAIGNAKPAEVYLVLQQIHDVLWLRDAPWRRDHWDERAAEAIATLVSGVVERNR